MQELYGWDDIDGGRGAIKLCELRGGLLLGGAGRGVVPELPRG